MADSGNPVVGEVIHKTDMNGFVTGIISEQQGPPDLNVTRYYYQTASGDKYSFATSFGPTNPGGYDDSFVTKKALVASLSDKANLKENTYTELGSFVASSGAHTITEVDNYRWLVFSMSSVGMIGVIDRRLLRNVYNKSDNCFYITSDESWCALYMSSRNTVRIASTNQAAATMKVYGVR